MSDRCRANPQESMRHHGRRLVSISRRDFLRQGGAAAALAALSPRPLRARGGRAVDLKLGYAAITWDGKDDQAIEDISALGFHGIQLRTTAFDRWGARPEELKHLLDSRHLALLC